MLEAVVDRRKLSSFSLARGLISYLSKSKLTVNVSTGCALPDKKSSTKKLVKSGLIRCKFPTLIVKRNDNMCSCGLFDTAYFPIKPYLCAS